jgi:hypothetical protein
VAVIPKGKRIEIFNLEIDGTFGRFKTRDSYEVNYLLSSLPLADAVDTLSTAAEAFPFESITFEEMIQRDIDSDRVQKEIVEDYLEGAREKVVFFPPLIVAVVSKENEKPLQVYDSVESKYDKSNGLYSVTYGRDKFQSVLNITDDDTGRYIEPLPNASGDITVGQRLFYVPYAATMKINSRHVQLVVIDGQHRFEAMRILWRTRRDLVQCMDVPVCIVYTPGAVTNTVSENNIVKNLREMFVTINTTSRSVSGHFIDLLKDHSLASIAVRSLATRWKGDNSDPWRSRLQMLEWNERRDGKARQLNREHSITTVSILADVLRDSLFSDYRGGVPQSLLNLQAIRGDLEANPEATRYSNISDENFDIAQEKLLKQQIERWISPALDVLFTTPRPYREKWETFNKAVDSLDAQREVVGVQTFRDHVLGEFRPWSAKDGSSAKDTQVQFESNFEALASTDKPFFYQVFQQALVRTWILCAQVLWDHAGISPVDVAAVLVPALEKFCFKGEKLIFDIANPYATRVLYQANKPNLNQWGKAAWAYVVSATLLQKSAWIELKTRVLSVGDGHDKTAREAALLNLHAKLEGAVKAVADEVKERIRKDITTNWRIKDYPKAQKDDLERLAVSTNEEDQHTLREKLEDLADEAFAEANKKFDALFGFALA